MHRSELIGQEKIPIFNEVRNFYHVTSWEDVPKYVYISHRYLSMFHSDDALHTKFKVIESILVQMKHIEYVWIDCSCISFDPDAKENALRNIEMMISNAVRFLIIPFKSFSPRKPPTFDLSEYSTRAWCALECSIVLARHPSKVRIAKIAEETISNVKGYTVKFISLPTHDKTLGVEHLVSSMKILIELVQEKKERGFKAKFSSAVQVDCDMVWNFLRQRHQEIFQLQGVRRNSDFFVRTKFASFSTNNSERGVVLYDQTLINTLHEMNKCLCCLPWQRRDGMSNSVLITTDCKK